MPDEPEISAECPLCGLTIPAIDVATGDAVLKAIPAYRMGPVERGRTFKVGELYLLHHGCLSMQAGTDGPYWDPDSAWWACKDQGRALDRNAHFDLNCRECAVRWASDLVP
ncbi:MAG: hypothetical protein ACYC91_05820 [Solirubrobacteraceae bacterium]